MLSFSQKFRKPVITKCISPFLKPLYSRVPVKHYSLLIDDSRLSDDQKTIQDSAYNFAKNELLPNAHEWDMKKHFPKDVYRKAAELGFAGIYVPDEYGGSGFGRIEASLIFEALATGCVGSSAYLSIHNMCNWMLHKWGNKEQLERWASKMNSLEFFSSYCLTEPNSGSDSASMRTTVKEEGDYYILNGSKMFISGGEHSDLYFIMCRTGEKEISCIIVEKGSPGLSFGKNENKMGWNVQPTQLVILENCKVPKKNLLGNLGDGFKIAMMGLDGGRINIASCSLGGAAYGMEITKEYLACRKQFNKPLNSFQHLQFKFAELATLLQASRLLTRNAAILLDENHPDKTMHSAMAKQFATDRCFDIVHECLQMHGGYGYLKDYPIERIFRDLRVHMILEGTNEIMKLIISKQLLKE